MLFSVTNMTCGGCVRSITKAIQMADPKASVSADLETRHVAVETSLRTDEIQAVLDKIAAQVAGLGGGYVPLHLARAHVARMYFGPGLVDAGVPRER